VSSRGEFLRALRRQSCPRSYAESIRIRADRPSSIVTLGRTIVVFYLAALMAAMISAKVLPEGEVNGPGARSGAASGPPPIMFDG
jgi:hypothetical protein